MKKITLAVLVYLLSSVSLSLAQWDRNYIGVNYKGFPKTIDEIDRDLAVLGPNFGYIRTYISLFDPQKAIPSRVEVYNLEHPATPIKVAMGVALTPNNPTASQAELDAVISLAKAHPGVVNAVVVGNENFGDFTEKQLIDYINYSKTQLSGTAVAVTTCQQWGVLYGHPDLVNVCTSYALANIYPYFDGPGYEGGNADQAGAETLKNWQSRFLAAYNQLAEKYPGKIRIGETGWPSGGSQVIIDGHYTGIPIQTAALPNEQTYIEQYARWASAGNLFSYLFSAIDEAWKAEPGGVGPHFGLYTENNVAKWILGQLPSVNAGTTLWLGNYSPYGELIFSGGTLLIIDPQTIWPNGFHIAPGTTSTLDNGGNSFTHTGTIGGSGNLIAAGAGMINHQGDGSGFSGMYTVSAGTLKLADMLGASDAPCTIVVAQGALLTGTGPVVGSLSNRGTVNPGNYPGTLNVIGSYAQTATGIYKVEITSTTSYDKMQVSSTPGTATLAGAIAPNVLGGFRPPGNQVFPGVITATGGITGTFGSILNQRISPTLSWQVRHNPTSVDLWVQRHYTNLGLSLSKNQQRIGTMMNSLAGVTSGDLNTVLHAIDYLPTSSAVAAAYQQISSDKASALPALSLAGSMMQWQSVANRLGYQRWRQEGLPSSAGGRSGSFNVSGNNLAGLMLAYNGGDLAGLLSSSRQPVDHTGTWGLYTDFVSTFGSQDSTAHTTGYKFTILGFTVGADYRLRADLIIGLGTGYYHTTATYKDSGGDADISSIPFYVYGAYTPGSFYLMGYVGYTLNLYNLNRNIAFGDLSRTAASSPHGNQLNVSLETGYDFKWAQINITPAFNLSYSTAWVRSFMEKGADSLNLDVPSQSADSLQTGLGMRVSCPLQSGAKIFLPQLYAFWQHEFANNSRGLDARLAQVGSTFGFRTDSPSRNFAVLGAGVAVGLKKNLTFQANYNTELGRGGYAPHVVSAGLRWEF